MLLIQTHFGGQGLFVFLVFLCFLDKPIRSNLIAKIFLSETDKAAYKAMGLLLSHKSWALHYNKDRLVYVWPGLFSTGVVSEQKSQTAEAGAVLPENAPSGCDARPQGTAGWHARPTIHGSAVLPPVPGTHSPPVPYAALRSVPPPPRPGQPVPLSQHGTTAGLPAPAWRLVQPAEGKPELTHVLTGLHAAPGPRVTLELKSNQGNISNISKYNTIQRKCNVYFAAEKSRDHAFTIFIYILFLTYLTSL